MKQGSASVAANAASPLKTMDEKTPCPGSGRDSARRWPGGGQAWAVAAWWRSAAALSSGPNSTMRPAASAAV